MTYLRPPDTTRSFPKSRQPPRAPFGTRSAAHRVTAVCSAAAVTRHVPSGREVSAPLRGLSRALAGGRQHLLPAAQNRPPASPNRPRPAQKPLQVPLQMPTAGRSLTACPKPPSWRTPSHRLLQPPLLPLASLEAQGPTPVPS